MKKTYISPVATQTVMIEESHLCGNSNNRGITGTYQEFYDGSDKNEATFSENYSDKIPGTGKPLKPSDGDRNAKSNDFIDWDED